MQYNVHVKALNTGIYTNSASIVVKRIKHDRNIKAYKSVFNIIAHGRRKEAKHKMFLRVTIDIVAAVQ